ncbi:MAG: aldehyde dehydrogenase family protein [Sedimentisphaerales bacterium]|nr:aldehyde dehydrogenase family protein [Sedimentisphaerales bacterium]
MAKEFKNYINGRWTASSDGQTFEQLNPANLEEVTGIWPASTHADARTAIEAAAKAYESWSVMSVYKRAEYFKKVLEGMKKRKGEFAQILTMENGKTLKESEAEINSAIKEMEFQINEGLRLKGQTMPTSIEGVLAYSLRRPLGVVSIISPWNFPFNVPGRKVTPALMAGNTCVFKPASLTPGTGQKFVELFVDADFPHGVINFVTGSGSTVGQEMITNPAIKAISFTGSIAVGRKINQKASEIMARTQLEMGGKNPIVVLEDGDLDAAAGASVTAAYACAGQWCTSTSRVIVTRKIKDKFIERLIERAKKIVVGNGLDEKTTMGPVCGKAQLESIMNCIDIGTKEGAKLTLGGKRIMSDGCDKGCFIEPTVFTDVKADMRIAQEEIFGPVLSIIEVSDFEEAVEVANNVEFGLSSSIYTRNLQKAFTFLEQTETGLTHVNLMTALKEPQLTFGGIKESGFGIPEAGKTGIEFFTDHKVAYVKYR